MATYTLISMATTYTLYGIPNCGSVKKARTWFDEQQLAYTFVDFKKSPPNAELIQLWLKDVDWNELVNRKGTTYRGLSDADKTLLAQVSDAAIAFVCEHASIIKRPVIHRSKGKPATLVGFDVATYEARFLG